MKQAISSVRDTVAYYIAYIAFLLSNRAVSMFSEVRIRNHLILKRDEQLLLFVDEDLPIEKIEALHDRMSILLDVDPKESAGRFLIIGVKDGVTAVRM